MSGRCPAYRRTLHTYHSRTRVSERQVDVSISSATPHTAPCLSSPAETAHTDVTCLSLRLHDRDAMDEQRNGGVQCHGGGEHSVKRYVTVRASRRMSPSVNWPLVVSGHSGGHTWCHSCARVYGQLFG